MLLVNTWTLTALVERRTVPERRSYKMETLWPGPYLCLINISGFYNMPIIGTRVEILAGLMGLMSEQLWSARHVLCRQGCRTWWVCVCVCFLTGGCTVLWSSAIFNRHNPPKSHGWVFMSLHICFPLLEIEVDGMKVIIVTKKKKRLQQVTTGK